MMLKTILSNILFLAACVAIAALSSGIYHVTGDWFFFSLFVILMASEVGKRGSMIFGTMEQFWDDIPVFLMACILTGLLALAMFYMIGYYAVLILFVVTFGALLIKFKIKPRFGVKEPVIYEKQQSVPLVRSQRLLNYMLILGACISLLGMVAARILSYMGNTSIYT